MSEFVLEYTTDDRKLRIPFFTADEALEIADSLGRKGIGSVFRRRKEGDPFLVIPSVVRVA